METKPNASLDGSAALSSQADSEAFAFVDVSVGFGSGEAERIVLKDVNCTVHQGEFVSVLGHSGTGKTTLLRIAAGLTQPHTGEVRVYGESVRGPQHDVAFVFQDYAGSMLDWRTVYHNVSLAIEHRIPRRERPALVEEALATVGLSDRAHDYPSQLSGGMQQRVQIARALVRKPKALLMDEPFGALDAMTKSQLQDELQSVHASTSATVLFVTHDVEEAVYLSDRVIVVGGSPATIQRELHVGLERPRDQITTRASREYLAIRSEILETIKAEHWRS